MIKELIKSFLNSDNTKNYIINKYISFFSLFFLKFFIKKDKISKTDFINYYLSRQYKVYNPIQVKYFFSFLKMWNNFVNSFFKKITIKILYQEYLKNKQENKVSLFQFKKEINEYFIKYLLFINEINLLFLSFAIKNKKLNKYLLKIKEITEILKSDMIDRRHKNNLVDEIDHLNKKHQKIFYSNRYDNMIMYYQKILLKLDSFIFSNDNIFMLSSVNYGYLNSFLTTIKYNFKTKGNIYKSQVFETFMLLNNFCRFMDRYGFKISYKKDKTITKENIIYILD